MNYVNQPKPKSDRNMANAYFFILMLLLWGVLFLPEGILFEIADSFIINSVVSELVIAFPALLMILIWYYMHSGPKTDIETSETVLISDRIMLRSVKPSTVLMTLVYLLTIMPLITLSNLISTLFVDNTVLEYGSDIVNMSVPAAIFSIALMPALCEELAFRGVVYGGYRKNCRPAGAIFISALLFGLMHGNINQLVYAFIIGIALALLAEATGSIWPTIMVHFLINLRAVVAMFIADNMYEGIFDTELVDDTSAIYIIIYSVLSVITTLMAGAVLSWISQNEGRDNPLMTLIRNKSYKEKRVSVWSLTLIIGVLAAIAMIVLVELSA